MSIDDVLKIRARLNSRRRVSHEVGLYVRLNTQEKEVVENWEEKELVEPPLMLSSQGIRRVYRNCSLNVLSFC